MGGFVRIGKKKLADCTHLILSLTLIFKVENENWQKGLRHQLTVNRSFTKAKKCKGAGWYWKLSEYILLLKDVKRIVDDKKLVGNTTEMTEGEEESETITGDIQSVLEPDEAFVVVKEETIESKLLCFCLENIN